MTVSKRRKNAPGLAKAIDRAGSCVRLARLLDLPYQTVASWKYRRTPPREIERICRLLKMRKSDFTQDLKGEDL